MNSISKLEVGSYYFNLTVVDSVGYTYIYMLNATLIDNCTIALFTAPILTYNINHYLNRGP